VNRANGALIRASAAEFAGQLIATNGKSATDVSPATRLEKFGLEKSRAIVNALIGAANDSEPWVRIAAVRTLGALTDEPRVVSAIAAHLNDTSRVVRVRAAEALMNHGITTLEGPGQRVLAAAQDEWEESLRTFGDIASDHTTLGWLRVQRGDVDLAAKELQLGASLDPADARPHVYLGVLKARAGQYDQALQQFKTAKALNPMYRNLDRLIEEVEKRSIKRH